MPWQAGRRRRGALLLAGCLGVALAVFVSGATATDAVNVFSGQWTTNTGSVSFRLATAAEGAQAIVAQGGHPCATPTVYYVGTYSDPGPRTGQVSGCTVGSASHLVARYVGDARTDPSSAGDIDITFASPSAFNGTYTADGSGQSLSYVGSFQAHFAGDGCCPTTPPTTTTTAPMTTTPTFPNASTDVFSVSVDPLFPFPGVDFSGQVGTFQSAASGGGYTASIDWGDGTTPTNGSISAPTPTTRGFQRSVSGAHTYARAGSYLVVLVVTDPHGGERSDANDATVTACFCATRPPVLGRTVDIGPVSGVVLVKLPAVAGRAHTAAVKGTGFVPLTEAREIPIGSELDTRRGKMVVMAATTTAGRLSGGEFAGGIFALLQNRRELGVTELRLRSGSALLCARAGKASTAAARPLSRRVLGLLHASVKGQFRTRGRFAAATVRGTAWTMTDRCDGTLTQVTRGVVSVRDLRRRRTVLISAGHSYLARAR
jgi:hypothetical protein